MRGVWGHLWGCGGNFMRLRRGHVVFAIIATEDNDSFLCFLPLRVALVVMGGGWQVHGIHRFAAWVRAWRMEIH